MVELTSRGICALALAFIALTDVSVLLNIPVLRPVLGFALVVFLPGFLFIQIGQFTKNPVEKSLFLVGLSVSFWLLVPLLMDLTFPTLGISQPITPVPLTVTSSAILAGLTLIAHWKGALEVHLARDFSSFVEKVWNPFVMGAALIVVLGVLGGLFLNAYSDSVFALLSLLSIAVVIVVIIISRRFSERFYPLYVVAIALALQYSHMLATPTLYGTDVQFELYYADIVRLAGFWNPSLTAAAGSQGSGPYVAMLSITVLPNVYSALLGVGLVAVFKVIFPFIFAFVPLGLYQIYKTHINFGGTLAFLSAFFFMSFFAFFYLLAREDIALLFLVLAILLILSRHPQQLNRTALIIVFIASLVVSHYTTTYAFLFYLAVIVFGSALIAVRNRQWRDPSIVGARLLGIAAVMAVLWYVFASGGAAFDALLQFGSNTASTLSSELFNTNSNPEIATGLGAGISGLSFARALAHYWVLGTEILIACGLVLMLLRRRTLQLRSPFVLLMLANFVILVVAVALPSVSFGVGAWRIFLFALLFLSPCCVFAITAVVDAASRPLRLDSDFVRRLKFVALICVLVPYFLFNYGFVFEIAENPSNFAFLPSPNQTTRFLNYSGASSSWTDLVPFPIPPGNVYASTWLSSSMGASSVYAESADTGILSGYAHLPPSSVYTFPTSNYTPPTTAYIYRGEAGVQNGTFAVGYNQLPVPISAFPALASADKVYSNGFAEVYYRAQ